jgi:hypothetical protein
MCACLSKRKGRRGHYIFGISFRDGTLRVRAKEVCRSRESGSPGYEKRWIPVFLGNDNDAFK